MTPHSKPALALLAQVQLNTPLGPMLMAANRQGLAGAWFEGQAHHPGELAAPQDRNNVHLKHAEAALERYWRSGELPRRLALAPHGTTFQQLVWAALREIPDGSALTYLGLAQALGRPSAVRAVAQAVARNPISVLVPCHRVLGAQHQLTGYAGGLERKAALLRLEGCVFDGRVTP
jgi:methylated-DNA-[protein]-cysteine S-methyltransferase